MLTYATEEEHSIDAQNPKCQTQTPSERTNGLGQTVTYVCVFVRLSVVSVRGIQWSVVFHKNSRG